jgi:REP element-mobilizing transposase RayT
MQYPGACYHVLSRGDRHEAIFLNEDDRRRFLNTLAEACERTGWILHSYVLMSNHYHWLLETPEPNLVEGMKWFQGTYTQRFNLRHRLSGHLFQGRYKAIPLDADEPEYFRRLWVYIHLNPVRAGILDPRVEKLESFAWSSHTEFLKPPGQRPPWLRCERVFGTLGLDRDSPASRRQYRQWVQLRAREVVSEAGAQELEEEWNKLRRGWYHGNEDFRDRLLGRVESAVSGKQRDSFNGAAMRRHDHRAARRLLEQALSELGIELAEVQTMKKTAAMKQGLVWVLKRKHLVNNTWISQVLNMGDRRNISRAVKTFDEAQSRPLRALRRRLEKMSQCPD